MKKRFLLPLLISLLALSAGVWRVRITTQYSGRIMLKTPHTFTFDKELTVGGPA
jgi:hypothetical protein